MQGNPLQSEALSETALAQLYRGELGRSDRWRTRLDTTTNWAVTTTAALISFTFANPDTPHGTLIVGVWLVVAFLFIEAKRYRYYDLFIHRVRLLESGFWAPGLRKEPPEADALKEMAYDLSRPQLRISLVTALAARIRQSYGPLLVLLVSSWYVKVHLHPVRATRLGELVGHARVGWVPGAAVFAAMVIFSLALALLYMASWLTRAPEGELRPRPGLPAFASWQLGDKHRGGQAPRPMPVAATPERDGL